MISVTNFQLCQVRSLWHQVLWGALRRLIHWLVFVLQVAESHLYQGLATGRGRLLDKPLS